MYGIFKTAVNQILKIVYFMAMSNEEKLLKDRIIHMLSYKCQLAHPR